METIPPTLYIALGTLAAAFITGSISLVNLVISKEQKISELRQDWINCLRNDVSDFIGQANSLFISCHKHRISPNGSFELSTFIDENRETIRQMDSLATRIKLRLNPDEHQEMIDAVDEIEKHYEEAGGIKNPETITPKFSQLHNTTQVVLKSEWKRVKSGEGGYLFLKRSAILIATTPVIIGALYLIKTKT